MTKSERKALINQAWSTGDIEYLLHEHQIPLYEKLVSALSNPKCKKFVVNCARRFGKSFTLSLIAIQFALKTPNRLIRFAAPTKQALKKITRPIFRQILKDCPENLRPTWKEADSYYQFPNGSEIHLAGTNQQNYEDLRGTASHLNICDEAGFMDDLEYVVKSILMPQTAKINGTTVLISTPPVVLDHDFTKIANECIEDGSYAMFTIWDDKTLTPEELEQITKEAGGKNSDTFKREWECIFVQDPKTRVLPEWNVSFVQDIPKPEYHEYFHKYVGMDIGFTDYTCLVFGYWDHLKSRLVIEDEFRINGHEVLSSLISKVVKEKELALWGHHAYRRIADNNNKIFLNDLSALGTHFSLTTKDNLHNMVGALKEMIIKEQLIVHPRCKYTIDCLRYVSWDKNFEKFARSPTLGHYDAVPSLIYLSRNIDRWTNPIPAGLNLNKYDHAIFNVRSIQSASAAEWSKILGVK